MGILPYQALESEYQDFSFMKQLYDRKMTTHQTVLISVKSSETPGEHYEDDYKTFVMFGNYAGVLIV